MKILFVITMSVCLISCASNCVKDDLDIDRVVYSAARLHDYVTLMNELPENVIIFSDDKLTAGNRLRAMVANELMQIRMNIDFFSNNRYGRWVCRSLKELQKQDVFRFFNDYERDDFTAIKYKLSCS